MSIFETIMAIRVPTRGSFTCRLPATEDVYLILKKVSTSKLKPNCICESTRNREVVLPKGIWGKGGENSKQREVKKPPGEVDPVLRR